MNKFIQSSRSVPIRGPVQVTRNGGHNAVEFPDGALLYFRNGGLWRMPQTGGLTTKVLKSDVGYYQVMQAGIYFQPISEPAPLQFYRFSTRTIEPVPGTEKHGSPGLSVSPNEEWILFSRYDHQGSELMLVENFR